MILNRRIAESLFKNFNKVILAEVEPFFQFFKGHDPIAVIIQKHLYIF